MTAVKHAVVFGYRGIEPQTVTHHVGLRYRRKRLRGVDIHVSAHYEGVHPLGSRPHDALIEGQLQVEQCLAQLLAALPAKYGHRREYLARRRV